MQRVLIGFTSYLCLCLGSLSFAEESTSVRTDQGDCESWQDKAVVFARIMSEVKWTPVADGMPMRGGYFQKGKQYTGVPFSSVNHV